MTNQRITPANQQVPGGSATEKPVTHIQPDGLVATRIELIRAINQQQQTDLLNQLTAEASDLRQRPGFVSLNVFASIARYPGDSPLLITFVQWQGGRQLATQYADSRFERVLQQNLTLKQREADLYTVVSSEANYQSHVLFQPNEPFVTILDVMEYSGKTLAKREVSLRFNLKNGAGYIGQPGCYGIAVLRNADLTRAVSIGQWASPQHFLAGVRNTAPGLMKWVLRPIKTIPQLNSLLQFAGRFLKNRPEYHVYRLHHTATGLSATLHR